MSNSKIPAGTFVSSGTLRIQDLTSAMLNVLGEYAPHKVEEMRRLYPESLEFLSSGYSWNADIPQEIHEELEWLSESLFEVLNEEADTFVYFGSSEGDGAYFSFWIDEESVREALDEHERYEEVEDWDEWMDFREEVEWLAAQNDQRAVDMLKERGIA